MTFLITSFDASAGHIVTFAVPSNAAMKNADGAEHAPPGPPPR